MSPIFPHCDSNILHSPGTCEFCDHYPDRQELRRHYGEPFTDQQGEHEDIGGRSKRQAEKWWGNRASKPTLVIVNGIEHQWVTNEATYEQIVRAAFPETTVLIWTITWYMPGTNRGGEVVRDDWVTLEEGMVFNVSHTGNA